MWNKLIEKYGTLSSLTKRAEGVNWHGLILPLLFILSLWFFFNFETILNLLILEVIITALFLIIGYFIFAERREDFLTLLVVYFTSYDIYHFHLSLGWPLWLAMIMVLFLTAAIFYLRGWLEWKSSDRKIILMYLSLLFLSISELFLSIVYWPIDPRNKGIIFTTFFYLLWDLISLKINQQFQTKKILPYLIVSFIIIFGVITTAQWQGY